MEVKMKAVYLGEVDYDTALALQEQFFFENLGCNYQDIVLFLEHTPVYTYGISVKDPKPFIKDSSLIIARQAQLKATSRGGLITFHGPGQLVGYPIFNIGKMGAKEYIYRLSETLRYSLKKFGIESYFKDNGLWVELNDWRKKICSFGIKIGQNKEGNRITMHGFALNVTVDMDYFSAINPCGIKEPNPMINMADLIDNPPDLKQLAEIITLNLEKYFDKKAVFVAPEEIGFYTRRIPPWLKVKIPTNSKVLAIKNQLRKMLLHTVCEESLCPNISECWNSGDITLMILGDTCTRSCGFCAVKTGKPNPIDYAEPQRVAKFIRYLPHSHIVLTSVNRDDIKDGGAKLWAQTIKAIRKYSPEKTIEVLVPDFKGNTQSILTVIEAKPDVFGHNIETPRRLQKKVRPQGNYDLSLGVLKIAKENFMITKSNIMVGHGESMPEIIETMEDLAKVGLDILTITQYLRPSLNHLPVIKYYSPKEFDELKKIAYQIGFKVVIASPLARTSYQAGKAYQLAQQKSGN